MTNNATVTAAVRLYQASGGDLDDTLACLDFIAGAETANHRPLTEAVARGGFRYALELTKSGLETLQRAERTEPGGTGTKDVVAIQQEIVAWSAERNGNTDPTACRRWLDGNSFHWDDYKQNRPHEAEQLLQLTLGTLEHQQNLRKNPQPEPEPDGGDLRPATGLLQQIADTLTAERPSGTKVGLADILDYALTDAGFGDGSGSITYFVNNIQSNTDDIYTLLAVIAEAVGGELPQRARRRLQHERNEQ